MNIPTAHQKVFKKIRSIPSFGYTLVELIVSITIISILTAVGIIGFSNYNKIQQLNQTAVNLELLISQARSNAQSVVRTIKDQSGTLQSCNANQLYSYRIIKASNTQILLEMTCDSTPPPSPTRSLSYIPVKTFDVSALGFNLASSTCTSVEYEALSTKVSLVGSTPCSFIISQGSTLKQIDVDDSGNTRVN